MKLKNSVKPLEQAFAVLRHEKQEAIDNHVSEVFRDYTAKGKTFDMIYKRLTWDLWWAQPKHVRDQILMATIPADKWVGGHPDLTNMWLDTLLRKVHGDFVREAMEKVE